MLSHGFVKKEHNFIHFSTENATVAPVEQQYIAVLHSRECHCTTGRTAIYRCTAQQTVTL